MRFRKHFKGGINTMFVLRDSVVKLRYHVTGRDRALDVKLPEFRFKGERVDAAVFKAIKYSLRDPWLSRREVAERHNVSVSTVGRVDRAKDFTDYKRRA